MTILLDKFKKNVAQIKPVKLNKTSTKVITDIYEELIDLDNEHKTIKRKIFPLVEKVSNIKKIPRPHLFAGIPEDIKDYILDEAKYVISYNIKYNKDLILDMVFVTFDEKLNINKFNDYMRFIAVWINFCVDNATRKCAKHQKFYIYLTPLKKSMPYNKQQILNRYSSNTGHTNGCVGISYIVIYRFEEWVKVFIHETFHSFGMDFNQLGRALYFKKIKNLFNIEVDIKFYETYCEIWCKIINCIFRAMQGLQFSKISKISKLEMEKKKPLFIRNFENLFNIEVSFSIFQGVKMLNHSDFTYENLYNKEQKNLEYYEETNILAYHVITPCFIMHLNEFMEWTIKNNINYVQFRQDQETIMSFLNLYRNLYRLPKIKKAFKIYENEYKKTTDLDLLVTSRMTIIE